MISRPDRWCEPNWPQGVANTTFTYSTNGRSRIERTSAPAEPVLDVRPSCDGPRWIVDRPAQSRVDLASWLRGLHLLLRAEGSDGRAMTRTVGPRRQAGASRMARAGPDRRRAGPRLEADSPKASSGALRPAGVLDCAHHVVQPLMGCCEAIGPHGIRVRTVYRSDRGRARRLDRGGRNAAPGAQPPPDQGLCASELECLPGVSVSDCTVVVGSACPGPPCRDEPSLDLTSSPYTHAGRSGTSIGTVSARDGGYGTWTSNNAQVGAGKPARLESLSALAFRTSL